MHRSMAGLVIAAATICTASPSIGKTVCYSYIENGMPKKGCATCSGNGWQDGEYIILFPGEVRIEARGNTLSFTCVSDTPLTQPVPVPPPVPPALPTFANPYSCANLLPNQFDRQCPSDGMSGMRNVLYNQTNHRVSATVRVTDGNRTYDKTVTLQPKQSPGAGFDFGCARRGYRIEVIQCQAISQ